MPPIVNQDRKHATIQFHPLNTVSSGHPTPPYMRVRIRRFNEAEQARPRVTLNSIPLELAATHSSCRLHWLSSWPCATDLCDFSRVGRHGVARRPTRSALGDVCVRDANASNSNSVCDAVSTVRRLRTVSPAMPSQSNPSSRVRTAANRQACDPLKFHGFCRLSRGCDA